MIDPALVRCLPIVIRAWHQGPVAATQAQESTLVRWDRGQFLEKRGIESKMLCGKGSEEREMFRSGLCIGREKPQQIFWNIQLPPA